MLVTFTLFRLVPIVSTDKYAVYNTQNTTSNRRGGGFASGGRQQLREQTAQSQRCATIYCNV